jgi:hypothetical protein
MFICFILSERSHGSPQTSQRIDGRDWTIEIIRSADDGPWYPHVAEQITDTDYRFFAGRLAGVSPSPELPPFSPFASSIAADWDFPSEEPDGSWIALKFDRHSDTLSIASDLFLLQRWYYAEIGGRWFFANSLRFLFSCAKDVEIDWRGAAYLLTLTYIPGRYTPLKNVFSLRSGETLIVERGRGRVKNRAAFPVFERLPFLADREISGSIHNALHDAVASELAGLENVVVPLSGGIDSRFLLAFALQVFPPEKITTMTFGHPSSLDFRIGTSLARALHVRNVALPTDDLPVRTLVEENFAAAEGVHSAYPFYPIRPYREVFGNCDLILSGYVGDVVFGSYDLSDCERHTVRSAESLIEFLTNSLCESLPCVVRPFLADGDSDPLDAFAELRAVPDAERPAAYHRWIYKNHQMNRTNFALEVHRDCAFYLAPFVHRRVLDVAYAVPPALRIGERAFFRALNGQNPALYQYPSTANFGFPLNYSGIGIYLARAWRKTLSTIDEKFAARWGRILYHHPRIKYRHHRELSRRLHRDSVLQCLEYLRQVPALNPAALADLRARYLKSQPLPWPLLRELFTLHLWLKHYGKQP